MEKCFFVTHVDPIFESREHMAFFDDFLFPQFGCNRVQMFENMILTVFQKMSDTIFFSLIHDNFGAANFFRCEFDSLVKVVRAHFVLNERFVVLQDTSLLELWLELFWSFDVKTDHAGTYILSKDFWWMLGVLFHDLFEHVFQEGDGFLIRILVESVAEFVSEE